MAKCVRCSASSLTLKLDFSGNCHSCHLALLRELSELRAFHDEYIQVPNAQAESERILAEASSKARQIIDDAEDAVAEKLKQAEADISATYSSIEADLKDQVKESSLKLSKLKKDAAAISAETKEFLANLLESSSKDFSISAKTNLPFDRLNALSKTHYISNSAPTFVSLAPSKFCERAKEGFVVFDFETTGLSPDTEKIIEVGAIRYDRSHYPVDRFHSFVNPGKPIPYQVSQINKIFDADVSDAPNISSVLPDFLRFINGYPIIAHNAEFDVSFLKAAINSCKIPGSSIIEYSDSLKLAKKHLHLESYKLSSVAAHFNIFPSRLHRALDDCETLGSVVKRLLEH